MVSVDEHSRQREQRELSARLRGDRGGECKVGRLLSEQHPHAEGLSVIVRK